MAMACQRPPDVLRRIMMDGQKLKILQLGEKVLRQQTRRLSEDEIRGAEIQELIAMMRETMRDAPGVGLAAPQIGVPVQLAVIEDRAEFHKDISPAVLKERRRRPVPFHVIVNPVLTLGAGEAEFFEGCLSMAGFSALVPRALTVRVEAFNERAKPLKIEAQGWYARILQHEIDHLHGTVYVDRMRSRSLVTNESLTQYWKEMTIEQVRKELGV
jgi:peptide deformylase